MRLFGKLLAAGVLGACGIVGWGALGGQWPAALAPYLPGRPAAAGAPAARGAAPVAAVTAVVTQADFPIRRRTIGFAEPVATVAIKARLDSQIMEQRVAEGQSVKAGDVLFMLDDRELKAQIARDEAGIARDKALLERTRADLVRKRDLVAKGAASPQQVDQAISDEAAAAATVSADEAALNLDRVKLTYTVIRAPISGRIGAIAVTNGNLVKANDTTALATITQITPIRVAFPLPERDLPAVQAALAAGARPPVRTFLAASRTPLATGQVDFVDSTVDVTSGTITIKAVFDNANAALWPGQYLDVDIEVGRANGAAVAPTLAIQSGQSGPFVYLVKPDQSVEVRSVTVVVTDGDRTGVSAGLKPGDRVVTDGQMRLFNGAKVRDTSAPAKPDGTPPTKSATVSQS